MVYKRLGELLVASKTINESQLKIALDVQRNNPGKKLGEIIVNQGFATQSQIYKALERQLGAEYIELSGMDIPKEMAQIISRSRSMACNASFFEIPIRLPPSICFIRSGPHSPDPFLYLHRLPLRPHGCFPAPWRWWPHARWNPDRCSLILPLTYFFQ